MAALLKKETWTDPSKKAGNILDYILEDTSDGVVAQREVQSTVTEELQKAPLIEQESNRVKSRILFITRDVSLLQKDSVQQLHFKNIANLFDEIHILVLSQSWQAKQGVERIEKNVWAYTTSGRHWWMQPFIAKNLAHTQLRFNDGFRPDIVVALDPFESGLAGYWIAEKYDREFQVHVTEDFLAPEFKNKEQENSWRLKIASFVLKRTRSVRTSTTSIKEHIQKKYTHLTDVSVLPRHYDINTIVAAAQSPVAQNAFPQFTFTVLYVGVLNHDSTLFRALDAARTVLHSQSIGFVVVGDGPMKKEFQKRAEILGITQQVLFEKDDSKLISYLASADVLLCTDTTEASDEVVIKAAAAGLPIIAAQTELRKDLFTDGESAFLCNKEDTIEFSQKLVKFLNANSLRLQFATNAKDIIKTRLHEDPEAYTLAYRDTIELVFSASNTTENSVQTA